ncbi:hypothetical protein CDAR_446011 [Caerostris darwini]|uniref:THAP-type domain-containing protein n=1 Tax=Caerostris darwini TaxID=1538125 RepID=A0AAV4U0H2_9ARAC|nr:hypothetical protein CDAR_446011 [Caerostris darwini]
MSPLRGAVIYDCTANDAKRKIQPPLKFVGPLGLSSREGWIKIVMRQGCSRLTVTARNVCPPLQSCKRHFLEKDLASPDDFD